MLKEERKRIILDEVKVHNRVLLTDIAEMVEVSIDTVRRDVKELHEERKLKKVHGGAISLGFFNNTQEKKVYSVEKKSKIAQKTLQLLENGQVILLSGGTTNLELTKALPDHLSLTCFTPSLAIANQLLLKPNVEVIMIGGKLSKNSQITIGGTAINMLSDIKVDLCLLGVNSIDFSHGITEFDWEIVEMKKAMLKASKKVIIQGISEKLNSVQRYKICAIEDVDVLVTELDPTNKKLEGFKDRNILIL